MGKRGKVLAAAKRRRLRLWEKLCPRKDWAHGQPGEPGCHVVAERGSCDAQHMGIDRAERGRGSRRSHGNQAIGSCNQPRMTQHAISPIHQT